MVEEDGFSTLPESTVAADLIIKPPALPVRIHKALPFLRQPVHVPVPDPGATSKPSHVGMSSNEERR